MKPHRPTFVLRSRGTSEAHAHAPVVADRYEHERINPTSQWLGPDAEFRVNLAQAVVGEENASAIRPLGQSPLRFLLGARIHEEWLVLKLRFLVPALLHDAVVLFFRDVDCVLAATTAAIVAVPVLQNRKLANGQGHGDIRSESGIQNESIVTAPCICL